MKRTTRLAGITTIIALGLTGCSDGDQEGRTAPAAAPATEPSTAVTNDASAPDPSTTAAARPVDTLVDTGIQQAQAGDLTSATTTFTNALALDPENKYAFYNLGLVAQTANDLVAAVQYYNQALAVDPKYTPAIYNKAISVESSAPDKAIDLYTKILRIDPMAATTYLRLSFLYTAQGKTDEASQARAQAITLDPTLADVPTP